MVMQNPYIRLSLRVALPLLSLVCLAAPPAAAMTLVPAEAVMTFRIPGIDPVSLPGSGTVSVDTATGTVSVPSGLISLPSPVVIPVTTTTAIASISAATLANQAGTFSFGGGSVPGEICPPAANSACVGGDLYGGQMGLFGTINIAIIPNIVVIPFDLDALGVGVGGSASPTITADAAPWTAGTAQVRSAYGTFLLSGSTYTGSQPGVLTLVTPTYISALGNLLPVFVSLSLEFEIPVPEPTTGLLLLAAGVAGALAARRRPR
jgi:hypothetical protein